MSVRAIAYARASTEELAADNLTLATQHDSVSAAVAERSWEPFACAIDRNIDASVAPGERPALGRALEDLAAGAAGALVIARLDRISHSVLIWADLVELSCQQGWATIVAEGGYDLSTGSGESVAALLAAAAREEQRWTKARIRAGLAAVQASGTRLGRPVEHSPETRHLVAELRAAGKTLRQIADQLTAHGVRTPRGGRWHPSTIHTILKSAHLDTQAAASGFSQDTMPTQNVATPPADQAALAADLDRRFPDSYNLSPPLAPESRGAR